MRRPWLAFAILALFMVALGPMVTAEAGTASSSRGQSIAGPWLFNIRAPGERLVALVVFSADGTCLASNQGDIRLDEPFLGISIASPSYGVWARRAGQQYDWTIYSMFQGRNGELLSIGRLYGNVNYRETDSLSGHWSFDILDQDGNLLYPAGGGSYTATRLPLISGE